MTVPQWPALVLAAGLGTRLRPLSNLRAKPALPVAGRPLILRILARLREGGIRRVVINLHHLPETITALVGDGAAQGLEVRYSWESEVLGSGGGPARALPLLAADRFFIVNGDTLAGVSLGALAAAHLGTRAQVTLAATAADLSKYNALLADRDGVYAGIADRGTELPGGAALRPWHFVGVQAVDAAAFAGVSPARPGDSLREVYPHLARARPGAVRVFPADGAFLDIGTPADYLRTVETLAAEEGVPLDRGAGTQVAASALVEHCILWDRVRIGEGAHLRHCIVADDVVIPAGARYDRAVITADGSVPL